MSPGTLHLQQLRREFELRNRKNGQYSLRAFARDLNVSPAALSLILNGKKGLSETKAKQVAGRIGFSKEEESLFIASVNASHARGRAAREEARETLRAKLGFDGRTRKIPDEDFAEVNNWYHLAILELLEIEGAEHNSGWLANRLNLSVKTIDSSIDRLIRVGLLARKGKRLLPTSAECTTGFDLSSGCIRAYHAEQLERASRSLFTDATEEREFLNMTFAFPKNEIREAKKVIREFQKNFAKKFYHPDVRKDSVYQLSVQFFRVDKEKSNA